MGGGCYRLPNRELIVAGGKCDNHCFSNHGGCHASDDLTDKLLPTCEFISPENKVMFLSLKEINDQIEAQTKKGRTVFLYTPDMFSNYYYNQLFKKLPDRNGNTYIAVNAGVKSLVDVKVDWAEVKAKGIKEIWIGVESASKEIRDKYLKPEFENEDIIRLTKEAKKHEINVCWYLVDGEEDDKESQLATYDLIRRGNPFRINIEELQ